MTCWTAIGTTTRPAVATRAEGERDRQSPAELGRQPRPRRRVAQRATLGPVAGDEDGVGHAATSACE